MKITHYCNSFIGIKENKTSLLCDPWVGLGNENAWLSFPIYKNGSKLMNNLKPNFIYISHLHCDHYDSKNLLKIQNKNLKIIIKNFPDKRLKKKIENLGFKNILELQPWKKYKLNKDLTVSIIPQMTSNSENKPDSISYDLDTSIIIQSNKTKQIFYNNVDNPLSLSDLKIVRKFVKSRFEKDIDLCCSPSGVASEYPHCFTNINRIKEKDRLIKHHLKILVKQMEILKTKNYFDAGGIYTIYGKFYKLNKFIASPTMTQIKDDFKNTKINFFSILGGNSLEFKNNQWQKLSKFNIKENLKKKIINKTYNEKYFYEKTKIRLSKSHLDKIFNKSKEKYFKILKNFKVKTSWKIDFYIYNS